MTALRIWIDRELDQLAHERKLLLAEAIDSMRRSFFDCAYVPVLARLPDLRQMAQILEEPVWDAVLAYYQANAAMNWEGNLRKALDIATEAAISLDSIRQKSNYSEQIKAMVPALYLYEVMLAAWLETDGPGYAALVHSTLDSIDVSSGLADIKARFDLLRASAYIHQGHCARASMLYLETIPHFDWEPPFLESLRGTAFLAQNKPEEAIHAFDQARIGFGEMGQVFNCNAMRLAVAACYRELECWSETMEAAENVLLQAGDLPNQAHIGIGLGLLGASLIHQDMRNEGLGCLTVSLETLEGLGWLRTEAEIALQRLTICQEKEKTTPGQICEGTIADAERLVYRLRSDDLLTQLESLRKDSSPG